MTAAADGSPVYYVAVIRYGMLYHAAVEGGERTLCGYKVYRGTTYMRFDPSLPFACSRCAARYRAVVP